MGNKYRWVVKGLYLRGSLALMVALATITAVQAAGSKSVSPVVRPPTAQETDVGSTNNATKEQLHYVYENGAYKKDNWIAAWNALAVVSTLLLGSALTVLVSDPTITNPAAAANRVSRAKALRDKAVPDAKLPWSLTGDGSIISLLQRGVQDCPCWISVLRSVLLLGSVLCCMGALLTSTVFIMVMSTKADLVPFEDAKDIVTALRDRPGGFACNGIPSMYMHVISWPPNTTDATGPAAGSSQAPNTTGGAAGGNVTVNKRAAAEAPAAGHGADVDDSSTCNTAANYLDFMCKNGNKGVSNFLSVPQGFTIAAAVLLVGGLFVHVCIKEHWFVTVLFILFVILVGAWFGSLLTFYSYNITEKQESCQFDKIYKAS